jgi:quercetin dioxygenase-like cupin family protein
MRGFAMTGTVTALEDADRLSVLGETLRPLLTNAMGSAIEIFDTAGPANAGPPPHTHAWEEVYVVLDGELEVTVEATTEVLKPGGVAHVPAMSTHSYRNVTDCHFLTITTNGNATQFFTEVSAEVEMNPPDIAGVVRVAQTHGITFAL